MTCGGCSGAVTRVLQRAQDQGAGQSPALGTLIEYPSVMGRHFLLRCQSGETRGLRQRLDSVR
jgi:hypothetical protein